MNIDIEKLKLILDLIGGNTLKEKEIVNYPVIGKFCIVRTYSAGVHFGIIDWINPNNAMECKIINAHRLWKWEDGGLSLSALAQNGLKKARINFTGEILLTNAIEFIPVTQGFLNTFPAFIEDKK